MGKIIVVIIAFILSLPLLLSNFVYVKPIWGFGHFSIYSALCIYFICFSAFLSILRLIFKNKILKEILNASIVFTSVLIVMFFVNIFILLLCGGSEFTSGANFNKFNSVKWQKADFENSNQREYMLKDLTKNILPNKDVKEIIMLLGDPHAIISNMQTYYPYLTGEGVMFRIINIGENGKIDRSEPIDKNDLYNSDIMKGSMIYYITGPAFMDHSTLDIYFDENGIFKEYKLSSG